jgi:hypothetical protein
MVRVAAGAATKGFRRAGAGVDVPAGRARLRAVGGRHLDQLSALPGELVAKHLYEPAPPRIENSAGEARTCLNHVGNLKALDDHRAVAIGVGARELVQSVIALAADLAMQPSDASDGFLTILGPFLTTRDDALSTRQTFQRVLEVSRVGHETTIRIGHQLTNAAVERHHRLGLGCRLCHLELAEDARDPLVAIAPQGARLRLALEASVEDSLEVTELGEAQHRTIEASPVEASQLTPGCERETPARRRLSRSPEQAVGRALLVAVANLLRGVLRRSSARDRPTQHRSTARRGLLPGLRDRVSAPEIR